MDAGGRDAGGTVVPAMTSIQVIALIAPIGPLIDCRLVALEAVDQDVRVKKG